MDIDHVHFFVDDAVAQRDWFINHMGWQPAEPERVLGVETMLGLPIADTHTECLTHGDLLFLVSAPLTSTSAVAKYLQRYAPGVADVAVRVTNLRDILRQSQVKAQVKVTAQATDQSWVRIQGLGAVSHTLIETPSPESPQHQHQSLSHKRQSSGIDHLVLNVPAGMLQTAVEFYQHLFDLQPQQRFEIQTSQSGLHSQVLYSPQTQIYFNINEPASSNSQIQTFLEVTHGAGVQHIALKGAPLIKTVQQLRGRGLPLLSIPKSYYQQLRSRLLDCKMLPVCPQEWQQIQAQQILIDWQPEKPESLLLQIFSKPIFQQPSFFLSLLSDGSRLRGLGLETFWHSIRLWKRNWNSVQSTANPPIHHDRSRFLILETAPRTAIFPGNAPLRLSLARTAAIF